MQGAKLHPAYDCRSCGTTSLNLRSKLSLLNIQYPMYSLYDKDMYIYIYYVLYAMRDSIQWQQKELAVGAGKDTKAGSGTF